LSFEKEADMFDPKKFTVPDPRPIPVVLLLDVSSSMEGAKIDSLNMAVGEMLDDFQHNAGETDIVLAAITFGGQVKCLYDPPYKKPAEVQWTELQSNGMTPMGTAIKMAKAMIEDKETTKSKWYRPLVILVSDGQPNDSWEQPMETFIKEGRSMKCDRMAMAIGQDANEDVLKRFIEGTSNPLFYAHNARDIQKFFKLVTISVSQRTKSKDHNQVPQAASLDPGNSSKNLPDDFG
jgi:uncharacterized protein YegL